MCTPDVCGHKKKKNVTETKLEVVKRFDDEQRGVILLYVISLKVAVSKNLLTTLSEDLLYCLIGFKYAEKLAIRVL